MPDLSTRILALLGICWLLLAGAIVYTEFHRPPVITIAWATETEFNTAGFNIYRSENHDGPFIQINEQLIPSEADPSSGAEYEFNDDNVRAGKTYYYRLEDVEYDNSREQHDIFSGKARSAQPIMVLLAIASGLVGIYLVITGLKPEEVDERRAESKASAGTDLA